MARLATYELKTVNTSGAVIDRDRRTMTFTDVCELADRKHDQLAEAWGVDVYIVRFTANAEKLESAYTTRPPWDPD